TVDTTVVAADGETVAIGGLITRSDQKTENKVPWLGDLPLIGAAFRYRQQIKNKTELMVIMTPHVVRTRADADAILAMEGKRMDWVVGDIIRTQGSSGMEPIIPTPPPGVSGNSPPVPPVLTFPGRIETLPLPQPLAQAMAQPLPAQPQYQMPPQAPAVAPVQAAPQVWMQPAASVQPSV